MKILGHRGIRQEENSRLPYQNTLEAIQYALEKSADGVELDVIASRTENVLLYTTMTFLNMAVHPDL
jgi:glycerophosphoryl diester phosphodiesterase